jgi:cell division protein ZapA
MVAPDRLAVLTALNLAHELQQRDAVSQARSDGDLFKLIDAANARLDGLLASNT